MRDFICPDYINNTSPAYRAVSLILLHQHSAGKTHAQMTTSIEYSVSITVYTDYTFRVVCSSRSVLHWFYKQLTVLDVGTRVMSDQALDLKLVALAKESQWCAA